MDEVIEAFAQRFEIAVAAHGASSARRIVFNLPRELRAPTAGMTDLDLLETDRLVLSGWRRDQIDDLVRLHGDPIVARYLTGHGEPWTMERDGRAPSTTGSTCSRRRGWASCA